MVVPVIPVHQSIFLCVLLLGCASPDRSNPVLVPGDEVSGGIAANIAARKNATSPAKELSELRSLVGDWEVSLELFDSGPQLATGSAQISLDLGGRYYSWQTSLEFEGQQIESRGLLGFDPRFDHYELLWISELTNAQRTARGQGDARRGGIYLDLFETDPSTGAVQRSRTILKIQDDDHFSLGQWGLDVSSSEWQALSKTSYRRVTEG